MARFPHPGCSEAKIRAGWKQVRCIDVFTHTRTHTHTSTDPWDKVGGTGEGGGITSGNTR